MPGRTGCPGASPRAGAGLAVTEEAELLVAVCKEDKLLLCPAAAGPGGWQLASCTGQQARNKLCVPLL